jgi:hypothetical protein
MKKLLLIGVLVAASTLVSGCLAVYEEHRAVRPPHVIYGPPHRVVEVVPAPPHWRHHHRPGRW